MKVFALVVLASISRAVAAFKPAVRSPIFKCAAAGMLLAIAVRPMWAQTAGTYQLTNIISDGYVPAAVVDAGFVDPWGISIGKDFWIDTAVTGFSYVNLTNGSIAFKAVIPSASGTGPGQPTGTVFNTTSGFMLSNGSPASFLFASLDGTVWGWNGKLFSTGNVSLKEVDNSSLKAVYTDIVLDSGSTAGTVLLAANFGQGAAIEVYDQTFKPVKLAGAFVEPNMPAGYAPYSVHLVSGQIYVTYMLRSTTTYSETLGPNTGFISVFDVNGNFIKRAISGGNLNAPWGIAVAPSTFGIYGGDLLVGNLGDGLIDVYDPTSFAYLGQLTDSNGEPILSKLPGAGSSNSYVGLWEIVFGLGTATSNLSAAAVGDSNTLYLAAGLNAETHGLFGAISVSPARGGTPTFGFSTSSPVATVANGQSTTTTLAISPVNGFSGPVTFKCAGLPANTACTFSSPTISVTPTASATEIVTIATGGKYMAGLQSSSPLATKYAPVSVLSFVGVLLLAGDMRRRRTQTPVRLVMWIVGAAVLAGTVTGCGGYGSSASVTPAGLSQVTMTASSGALSRSATIALTVQ